MAYQTFVVIILSTVLFALSQLQGNPDVAPLPPLFRVVIFPALSVGLGLALNQMKALGQPAPNTVTETKTATVTPPPDPPKV